MAPTPMYESFAAVTLLVLGLLVVLARASQAMFEGEEPEAYEEPDAEIPPTGAARIERHADAGLSRAERREREILDDGTDEGTPWDEEATAESPWDGAAADARRARERARDVAGRRPDELEAGRRPDELEFTTGTLLANVAVSHGVFAAAVVAAAWLAEIPPTALGVIRGDPWSVGLPALALGVAVGVALYVADELFATVADAAGIEYSEELREALAPDTLAGWVVLLGVILPIIAGFEELLFRAALIGAFATGFGVPPWILAVFSTVAFAVGHGAQGPGGVAVTGLLGFALAAAFVLTGSLLVVVVAHYLVNALEFGVHEGLGVEWV